VAADPLIGATVAGYRIEACIGRGGMSRVYRAKHLRLGRRDALKLLSVNLIGDVTFRERFEHEWRVAARIDHPNIIPVFDAGEAGGHFYIAMRYVETTDLHALLEREGPLEPARAARILGQTASALDEAHLHGLVHRDVKPGNILVAAGDHVYLSDFGLAKLTAADKGLTRTGYFIGTADYAAPEQIRGMPLDGRADVYGLGCVAYECLAGARPYQHESDAQLMDAHLREPPPRISVARPDVPRALDGVLAKALAKSREDRYATCGAFAAAVAATLVHERGGVRGVAPAPPTVRAPIGRHLSKPGAGAQRWPSPAVLLGGIGTVAAIAVVAALAAFGGGSDSRGGAARKPRGPTFADSFSDPARGWYRYESRTVRLGYAGGAYEFLIKVPNWRAHADTAFAAATRDLGDTTVAVDAVRSGGPGAYGVLCREIGASRYYALEIASNGIARIAKVAPGEFTLLATRQSARPNPSVRVKGSCVGGRGNRPAVLTLSVDGKPTLRARDRRSPYVAGAVGLVAESFARGRVRVAFDDLVVRRTKR
jgi:hypothetical protein